MKRSIALLAFLLTAACSSTTEPGDSPKWADNTSWKGSVTLKSGTTLNVSFHLATALYTDAISQHEIWGISLEHARIENVLTGRVAEQWPDRSPGEPLVTATVRADFALELSMLLDSTFDPSVPGCATAAQPENAPYYRVNLQIAGDGTLRGTVYTGCYFPGDPLDSWPIVVRRI